MEKLFALMNLFRVGDGVKNPADWKKGGIITVAILAPVILAINRVCSAFGFDLHIDDATAGEIATGIIAVVHVVFTLITSDKVGILPAKPDAAQQAEA